MSAGISTAAIDVIISEIIAHFDPIGGCDVEGTREIEVGMGRWMTLCEV